MILKTILMVPVLLALFAGPATGQEILRPLGLNSVLAGQQNDHHNNFARAASGSRDTLCLPFVDDFANPRFFLSAQGGACDDTVCRTNAFYYPNNLLWTDENTFINSTYPLAPPTYGVATFDGLNRWGKPYNEDNPYGPSDTLTSKPIRLGGVISPDVYLSFFVQPGGRGDNPESQDSILLEFRKMDSTWHQVWSLSDTNGTIQDSFKIVMIPVTSADWLYDGFQFRFRNYASRSGNNDHWHLDYVFLDEGRSVGDSLFRDVSFAEPPSSMLKNYREMPWLQFRDHQADELSPDMRAKVRNIFNVGNNTNFQDSLLETYSSALIGLTPSESAAIPARGTLEFTHNNQMIPSSAPNYNEDSMSLTWKLRLKPSDDINAWNDTLLIRQNFYNYYALDDGSAEVAYGLIGTGAKLALKFETNEPDTIDAVYIHWAFVNGANSDLFFSILIFETVDTLVEGVEDSILYQQDFRVPKYRNEINGFWVYNLEEPVPVNGTFYLGWLQSQSDLLNVGFDRNTDSKKRTWYNLGDVWIPSVLEGTVMMRPKVGPDYQVITTVGIEDEPFAAIKPDLEVWPNPTDGQLYFELADGFSQSACALFDITGRKILAGKDGRNSLDLTGIPEGMYILEVQTTDGFRITSSVIKQ